MSDKIELDLDAIEAAAKAATPGEWYVADRECRERRIATRDNGFDACCAAGRDTVVGSSEWTYMSDSDAAFVTAANPAVVLELVRRLRAAEALASSRIETIPVETQVLAVFHDIRHEQVKEAEEFAEAIRARCGQQALVVFFPVESSIDTLDEEQMRQAGWVREPQWQPMETVPTNNEPILVLLDGSGSRRDGEQRVQHAQYALDSNGNPFGTIGDHFAFDKPEPIGWMYPPAIPDNT